MDIENKDPMETVLLRNRVGIYGTGAREETTGRKANSAGLDVDLHNKGSRMFGPLSQSEVNSKFAYSGMERSRPVSKDLSTLQNAIKSLKVPSVSGAKAERNQNSEEQAVDAKTSAQVKSHTEYTTRLPLSLRKGTPRRGSFVGGQHSPSLTLYDGDDVVMEDAVTPSPICGKAYENTKISVKKAENGRSDERGASVDKSLTPCPEKASPKTPQDGVVPETDKTDPISEGRKLAQQLHDVAEKLGTPTMSCFVSPCGGNMEQDETIVIPTKMAEEANYSRAAMHKSEKNTRNSSLIRDITAPILDLNGFDAHGDRRRSTAGTPLILASKSKTAVLTSKPASTENAKRSSDTAHNHGEEIERLRQTILRLESQKEEAGAMLQGYQDSISSLQDKHSKEVIRATSEVKLMKTEVERLRRERADIHSQFEALYNDKYVPLKTEAAALRKETEELRARDKNELALSEEISMLRKELVAAKQAASASQKAVEAAEAQKRAALESESLAKEKAQTVKANADKSLEMIKTDYEKKIEHLESSLQLKNKEIEEKGTKSVMLRQKLDETMHKLEVATAIRDRRQGEINSREEEICALQVRLKEVEGILGQYKAENEKFFKLKEKYKATIASLERDLRKKEAEKVTLTQMCDQLLSEKEERVLLSSSNK